PPIPIEVAEQIIDQLVDDRSSLRSCALVCDGWLPRSRAHLFREIEITALQQLYSLVQALSTTPSLGVLIQ
ncbi:hypothetical protein C8Q76DRAFT_591966, partial [Earliella scabrosa]